MSPRELQIRACLLGAVYSAPSRVCLDCSAPLSIEEQAQRFDVCLDCYEMESLTDWTDATNVEPIDSRDT